MKALLLRTFVVGLMIGLLHGCATKPHSTQPAKTSVHSSAAPTIFMIGDSTMANKPLFPAQPERGWGQLLPLYFKDDVRIVNLARNGRSSKSFRDEGLWQPVLDQLKPGDYVIIQFGHNDQKGKGPERFTEPFGTFSENLTRYIQDTRELGGNPILATSIVRRKFTAEGKLENTHGDYIVAARQVAEKQKVPLLDLEKSSAELITRLGPERSKSMFMWYEPGEFATLPNGREDDTHLNAYGACRICDLATAAMREQSLDLAEWLRPAK